MNSIKGTWSGLKGSLLVLVLCFLQSSIALPYPQELGWIDDVAERALTYYDGESILLIGELHGSQQTPALFSRIVTRLSEKSPVTVALEISSAEQVRLKNFLASDGSEKSLAEFLNSEFWQVAPGESDGRQSVAMLGLIDSLRRLSIDHAEIKVVLLDPADESSGADDRRRLMAERIEELAGDLASGPVVVLTGNYHARLTPNTMLMMSDGKPIEPPAPTASLVKEAPLTSFDVAACEGEIWACPSDNCGPYKLSDLCPDQDSARFLPLDPRQDGYNLRIMLPRHDASPPATAR